MKKEGIAHYVPIPNSGGEKEEENEETEQTKETKDVVDPPALAGPPPHKKRSRPTPRAPKRPARSRAEYTQRRGIISTIRKEKHRLPPLGGDAG